MGSGEYRGAESGDRSREREDRTTKGFRNWVPDYRP